MLMKLAENVAVSNLVRAEFANVFLFESRLPYLETLFRFADSLKYY